MFRIPFDREACARRRRRRVLPRTSISILVPGCGAIGGNVRHPDSPPERRRERPARHLAAADDRVARTRNARTVDRERNELLRRTFGAACSDRLGADEAGLLLTAPAQTGLDRPAVLAEVVAVQVKADLEAQRVARTEAGGHRPGVNQRVPDARGVGRVAAAARPRPRRCSRCRRRASPRRRPGPRSSASSAAARVGEARRPAGGHADPGPQASRSRRGGRSHRRRTRPAWDCSHARSFSWLAALVTVRNSHSARR